MSEEKIGGLITPREAIAEVLNYAGSEFAAKQVLADGLHSGRLRLVADYVWETDTGDIRDEWEPRRHGDRIYHEDAEIEAGNFALSAQWPKDLTYWRWDEGEFVIITSEADDWGRFDRIYIQGALFVRHEVLTLVGRNPRSGGPKADRERWAMFWINILWRYTRDTVDWTQFQNPHSLKQAFLQANDEFEMFSNNNVDFAVDLAWKHLVRRSASEAIGAQLRAVTEE